MLNFKYESCLNAFDSLGYKLEIANIIKEDKRIIEDLKLKTLDFVRSKIAQNTDADSWKISLFTDGEINSEAINLENALTLTIKKETQIHFSFIIFIIENKSALSSYVISASNEEMYKYWQSLYMKLKFEGIKMKNAINENVLNFIDRLDTPFIFVTFLQLNQIFRDAIAEFEEAKRIEELQNEEKEEYQHTEGNEQEIEDEEVTKDNIKPPLFIFMRILNEQLYKETINYFNTPSFKEFVLRDFLKIIISENSQIVSNEKLLTMVPQYITPYQTTFEIIFSLFEKENEIIELNNLMSILEGLISNNTQNLMHTILIMPPDEVLEMMENLHDTKYNISMDQKSENSEISDDDEQNKEPECESPKTVWQFTLINMFQRIIKALYPSNLQINNIEKYFSSLESIYGIGNRIYNDEDLDTSAFLSLEFWIEISKVIKDLPTLISLSERALEIQEDNFFHEPNFCSR